MFKTRANISKDRRKQILMLLGRSEGKTYIAKMTKDKKLKEVMGVTKYAWHNEISESIIDSVNKKELLLSGDQHGASTSSDSTATSGRTSKVDEVISIVEKLSPEEITAIQKAVVTFLSK